jgi:hypothetical protein
MNKPVEHKTTPIVKFSTLQENITLADIFNESELNSYNISEEEVARWWNSNKVKIK